jgi:hypothetical protein
MLDVHDQLILLEAQPALMRIGRSWTFERARHPGPKPRFTGRRIRRLVDAGLLRWVNDCRTAVVLTEEGERKAKFWGQEPSTHYR